MLDVDRDFEDFNFCDRWDPTLKTGPSKTALYKMVYQARNGDPTTGKEKRFAADEFSNTMYWTLRRAAFDAYLRVHGQRAITYEEWFYNKLLQFFAIMLYEKIQTDRLENGVSGEPETDAPWDEGFTVRYSDGPVIQPDEVMESLVPDDNVQRRWFDLLRIVCAHPEDRAGTLRGWLQEQCQPEPRSGWRKNEERDQVIVNCLARGMDRRSICEELDKRTIPTLPGLQKRGFQKWVSAWDDVDGNRIIQQLFSKVQDRKLVKPLGASV